MYNHRGLANYAEGGVVPEEIGTDAVGDLFTSVQRPPITRRYFTPPIQQADGTYGNTGYDPSLAPRTIGQTQYYNPTVPPVQIPPGGDDYIIRRPLEQIRPMPMPIPMPGDNVSPMPIPPPSDMVDRGPYQYLPPPEFTGGPDSLLPDWLISTVGPGEAVTQAAVEHTNPITGEKVTVENGGYGINPAYIESQLNNAYTENLGRDIGAPGLEFYQDQLNKNTQDASTGKSFDQIVADLDYSGEGQAYVSPAETEADRVAAQTQNLMQAYQNNLGRDIGAPGLEFYSSELDKYNADPSTGKSMQQIMADLAFSKEGQAYTPPVMPMFGSNGGGNGADDARQVAAHQAVLDANAARRAANLTNRGPGGEFTLPTPNNFMNIVTGFQDGVQRFGEDLSTGIGNYIDSGGIGGVIDTIFGGGNGADDAKQVAQAQANANAAASAAKGTRYGSGHPSANAASAAASNAGGIYKYGIGGLVNPYGHRR
tara:strand:- start:138 stop:1583 length:1446 start_codon:yes stop_codon:yes gene_type:complete